MGGRSCFITSGAFGDTLSTSGEKTRQQQGQQQHHCCCQHQHQQHGKQHGWQQEVTTNQAQGSSHPRRLCHGNKLHNAWRMLMDYGQ